METDEENFDKELDSIKSSAKGVESALVSTINRLKLAQHKLKLELEELSETELRSRPNLREWLQKRNCPDNCSFQEFFELFLKEHERESRLYLSERKISLNQDACKLFGCKEFQTTLSILEILERLPKIYH